MFHNRAIIRSSGVHVGLCMSTASRFHISFIFAYLSEFKMLYKRKFQTSFVFIHEKAFISQVAFHFQHFTFHFSIYNAFASNSSVYWFYCLYGWLYVFHIFHNFADRVSCSQLVRLSHMTTVNQWQFADAVRVGGFVA